MKVDAPQGPLFMRPTTGGLMGDSNEPEIFMEGYYNALSWCVSDTHQMITEPTIVLCPITGEEHNASLCAFIDDLFRIIIQTQVEWSLKWLCNYDAESLEQSLEQGDYTLNRDKAELVFSTPARKLTQELMECRWIVG